MFTMRSIDTFIGQPESFDGFALHQVRFNNFNHIVRFHPAIPDAFGIDDYGRPVFALIQTPGAIGSHVRFQPARRQLFFELQLQLTQSLRVTTATRVFGWTQIGADEDVMHELCHTFLGRRDTTGQVVLNLRSIRQPCVRVKMDYLRSGYARILRAGFVR